MSCCTALCATFLESCHATVNATSVASAVALGQGFGSVPPFIAVSIRASLNMNTLSFSSLVSEQASQVFHEKEAQTQATTSVALQDGNRSARSYLDLKKPASSGCHLPLLRTPRYLPDLKKSSIYPKLFGELLPPIRQHC